MFFVILKTKLRRVFLIIKDSEPCKKLCLFCQKLGEFSNMFREASIIKNVHDKFVN